MTLLRVCRRNLPNAPSLMILPIRRPNWLTLRRQTLNTPPLIRLPRTEGDIPVCRNSLPPEILPGILPFRTFEYLIHPTNNVNRPGVCDRTLNSTRSCPLLVEFVSCICVLAPGPQACSNLLPIKTVLPLSSDPTIARTPPTLSLPLSPAIYRRVLMVSKLRTCRLCLGNGVLVLKLGPHLITALSLSPNFEGSVVPQILFRA